MEQRCTCGAILPDDARFCHKCGKPQFEEDIARLSAQESPPPVQPSLPRRSPAPPSGISFRNSRAVLISLSVAAGALCGLIAIALFAPPLFPFVLCAAGFAAVKLYRGRSAEPLSTAAGARLGWMTGLWLFFVVAVLCAVTAIVVASPSGWDQLKATWAQVPQASKLLELNQHDFLVQLLISLPFSFLLLTMLPGLGGMLGAKLSARGRHSS